MIEIYIKGTANDIRIKQNTYQKKQQEVCGNGIVIKMWMVMHNADSKK